jgi:hypothetical protein
MARLAMVYDADGGLVGEVRYVVGHLLGRAECALCDITHGPVSRKREFDRLVGELESAGHRIEVLHRNEQDDRQAAASSGHLPCVIISDDGNVPTSAATWKLLVTRAELASCHGEVDEFRPVLLTALDGRS